MNIFDKKNNFEFIDYIKILWRRKFYFLIPFVILLSLGTLYTYSREPVYTSFCSVQLNPTLLPANIQRVTSGVADYQIYSMSYKREILSTSNLKTVIKNVNIDEDGKIAKEAEIRQLEHPNKTVEELYESLLIKKLRDNVSVREPGDNLIIITANANSPEVAHRIVEGILNEFMVTFIDREMKTLKNISDFNMEQIQFYKNKLEEGERKLNELKRKLVISKDSGADVLSQVALQRINDAVVATDLIIKSKNEYLNYLKSKINNQFNIDDFPKTPVQNLLNEIKSKLYQGAELLRESSWQSSEVVKVNRGINDLRDKILEEISKYNKMVNKDKDENTSNLMNDYEITLVDIEIAKLKKDEFNKIIDDSKLSHSVSEENQLPIAKLEEEVSVSRNLYNMFLQQIQGSQIETAIQKQNASKRFNIIEPALEPLEPSNTRKLYIGIGVLIGTILISFGIVIVKEYKDKTIRTVEEAEDFFKIPVIGVVPNLGSASFISINKDIKIHHN